MKRPHQGNRDDSLFDSVEGVGSSGDEPLASRMRPRTVEEFVGQDHIMGPGRLLRRAIQADMLSSVIFAGPPGTGKTTLARVIANTTKSKFVSLNAVLTGVKEVREAIAQAQEHRSLYGRKTILFVDEVHRWNKAQQDALLPWVENGTVVLIGATTENPFFEVNSALVSRSRIFQLTPLTRDDMYRIAGSALADPVRGYGRYRIRIDDDALDHLVEISDGDARTLLNALQLAVETTPDQFPPEQDAIIHVDRQTAEESIQKKVVLYDKEGDYHFDTISAFIKSLRGSDPDAALYWMARMIHAGEDPHFLFRRMLILAGEDVGLADPMALVVVQAAAAAFDRVGLPEGQFHLTHAALYLATAPKSNSALGYFDALKTVQEESQSEVPSHLKDASRDKEGFGHGEGYLYPHAYRDHWVAQAYLPAALRGKTFYDPSGNGYEERIAQDVQRRRELQLAAMLEEPPQEVLTFSPESRSFRRWMDRVSARAEGRGTSSHHEGEALSLSDILAAVRTRLFEGVPVRRHDRVLVFDPSHGSLTWEAFRRAREGFLCVRVPDERTIEVVSHAAEALPEIERPAISAGPLTQKIEVPDGTLFDAIVLRDPFTRGAAAEPKDHQARFSHIAASTAALLSDGGRFGIAQIVPRRGQRLSSLLTFGSDDRELQQEIGLAEAKIYERESSPLVGWTTEDLRRAIESAGLIVEHMEERTFPELRTIRSEDVDRWLAPGANRDAYGTVMNEHLSPAQIDRYRALLSDLCRNKQVTWEIVVAYLFGRKAAD